jgi:multiple sugar transport system permease protein
MLNLIKKNANYLFVIPAVVMLFLIVIFPLMYTFSVSFQVWDLPKPRSRHFVGLANYVDILTSKRFWSSMVITFIFVGGSVVTEMILGFYIAALLNVKLVIFRPVVRTLLIIPMMVTPVVAGTTWKLMTNFEFGVLNYLVKLIGLPPRDWLGSPATALAMIIITDVWQWTPFVILIILAGFQSLPPEPYEAALVDGASNLQAFRYITFPLMKPFIGLALILRVIYAYRIFDTAFVMTRGGPGRSTEVISLHLYYIALNFFHLGTASAISFIVIGFATIFSMVFINKILVVSVKELER